MWYATDVQTKLEIEHASVGLAHARPNTEVLQVPPLILRKITLIEQNWKYLRINKELGCQIRSKIG